ncbi:hypothetical protein Y032_0207g2039 [Ancylostoma ceylanicum]|uniref:Uncharacterized protein n=2 Tax=Ancylostoma ceylanicum TaxID=53326 RepID=A0A016SL16_9BILA|nr:hypothetical protein Y032_0207g2039 [Ancylostoma ceylanicum]
MAMYEIRIVEMIRIGCYVKSPWIAAKQSSSLILSKIAHNELAMRRHWTTHNQYVSEMKSCIRGAILLEECTGSLKEKKDGSSREIKGKKPNIYGKDKKCGLRGSALYCFSVRVISTL